MFVHVAIWYPIGWTIKAINNHKVQVVLVVLVIVNIVLL